MKNVAGCVSAMDSEDRGVVLFLVLIVALTVFSTFMITSRAVQAEERNAVCAGLGYKHYDRNYLSCVRGEAPIEMMKYELVLEGVHND